MNLSITVYTLGICKLATKRHFSAKKKFYFHHYCSSLELFHPQVSQYLFQVFSAGTQYKNCVTGYTDYLSFIRKNNSICNTF